MNTVRAIGLGASVICFVLFVACFLLYRIFENEKSSRTATAMAWQRSVKHKKGALVLDPSSRRAISFKTVKHRSKALYVYTVGGKSYKLRKSENLTANQMPKNLSVVYLKSFPRIRCERDGVIVFNSYGVYAGVAICVGACILLTVLFG